MAQSPEKLAKDIVVAWLSNNNVSFSLNDPEKIGHDIGHVYTGVLEAVRKGTLSTASLSVNPAVPERGRRGS
jgi:hypothetical protein